jgi:2-hydroxychromene-2-carboxylate isomerase
MMPKIDFYFFTGSTYTYLSVMRAAALAEHAGVELVWRPFSVRRIMREQNNSPFVGKPVKMAYMWRDVERRAATHGVPFRVPPPYPIDADESVNHVATLAAMEGWCPEFARAAYDFWFMQGEDPGTPDNLRTIIVGLGREADAIMARAAEPSVRERYDAHTDAARALGIFGSPTFACGREIFWGDDRLEDALAWARAHTGD